MNFKENHVDIHLFHELVWDLVPEEVVSNMYIDSNEDFFRDILFHLYNMYKENILNIKMCANIISVFMTNMFEHNPDRKNIIDNWLQ